VSANGSGQTTTGAGHCFEGGRPDLAFDVVAAVQTPNLLIVGSSDVDVLEPNAWAASDLQTSHAIKVVGGLAISLKSLAA